VEWRLELPGDHSNSMIVQLRSRLVMVGYDVLSLVSLEMLTLSSFHPLSPSLVNTSRHVIINGRSVLVCNATLFHHPFGLSPSPPLS